MSSYFSKKELLGRLNANIQSGSLGFTGEDHLNGALVASNSNNADDMLKSFHETSKSFLRTIYFLDMLYVYKLKVVCQ
jgi:hypothetical protein